MERNNTNFDEMTCYDNCSCLAHPKVIDWVCNSEQQFAQRNMNCMARLQQAKKEHVGNKISISGWINKKRDHGNLLFIDLRDNYGITQCIIDNANKNFKELEKNSIRNCY